MQLAVRVTEEDIDTGTDTSDSCPFALAATRALHEAGFEDYRAEWEPYWCDADGFTVHDLRGTIVAALPVGQCPDGAVDFALMFDDWYRGGDNGEDDHDEDGDDEENDGPYRPVPFSCVLEVPLAPPGAGKES